MSEKEESAVQLIEKKVFYQDRLQAMLGLVLGMAGIAVLLGGFVLVLFQQMISPPKVYFKASDRNQIIPEPALDKAGIANNVLLTAVVEAMNSAHTFNFMNYARRMEKVKMYFSQEGYNDYVQALNNIGLLQLLVQNKWVLLSMPLAVPEVLKEGPLGNRYLWKIKVPMQFNYRNSESQIIQEFDITLLLVRVSTEQSPLGIQIYKYEIQRKE